MSKNIVTEARKNFSFSLFFCILTDLVFVFLLIPFCMQIFWNSKNNELFFLCLLFKYVSCTNLKCLHISYSSIFILTFSPNIFVFLLLNVPNHFIEISMIHLVGHWNCTKSTLVKKRMVGTLVKDNSKKAILTQKKISTQTYTQFSPL